ncbi:MAG: hypothetical protein KKA28_00655 [Planctomycetes bacterium]|nr:hypothetical protein [Planctomycetota bacterium]MCG2684952.1 hypothetical protein [Planctomycetales bacterium]
MRHTCRNWTLLLTGALVALAAAPPTAADVITIDFMGLNLKFADGDIYDADHLVGGNGSTADATALGSITFYKNYDYVTSLDDDVYADILVQGVPGLPANEPVATSGGLYVDLLSSSNSTLLRLSIGAMGVFYTTGSYESVAVSGIATGIIAQNLPDGLIINPGDEITIFLMGDSLSGKVFTGELLTGFTSSGTGQIEAIPEPGSLMILLSLAASALAVCAWRVASMKARCL